MTSITLFSSGPGCHLCFTTEVHLKRRGLKYEKIRIDQDPAWLDRLKEHGFMTAPVVLVGEDDVWEGYSSDSLDEWARDLVQKVA